MIARIVRCLLGTLPLLLACPAPSQVLDQHSVRKLQPKKLPTGPELRGTRLDVLHNMPAYYAGAAMVGIDALGRIAVATDSDADGLADIYYLFIPAEPLGKPWSRYLPEARIRFEHARLKLESLRDDYAFSVAVRERTPMNLNRDRFAEVFEHYSAVEVMRYALADDREVAVVEQIRHDDLRTWPEDFGKPPR